MTAREMQEAIGQKVYFVAGTLKFLCDVIDVKVGWGQPRFLISPVEGYGSRWVEFSSIEKVQTNQLTSSKGPAKIGVVQVDKPVAQAWPGQQKIDGTKSVVPWYRR